jgi:flagellar basal-body rod protein FlgC
MDYFRAAEISGAGMLAQKIRIETAASNIANMTTSAKSVADAYRPLTVVMRPEATGFSAAWERSDAPASVTAQVVEQTMTKPRFVHEPGHPDADEAGMVAYPAIDHLKEMMTVMTALRSYEANLAALQASKTLALKALEIGGQ